MSVVASSMVVMGLQEFARADPGSNFDKAVETNNIYYYQIQIDNDNIE